MPVIRGLLALLVTVAVPAGAQAVEWPSFMQVGDMFCTEQADFDDYVAHRQVRPNSATETCRTIQTPTRVAIISGQGGQKTMVRITSGPDRRVIGWTNGALPLATDTSR